MSLTLTDESIYRWVIILSFVGPWNGPFNTLSQVAITFLHFFECLLTTSLKRLGLQVIVFRLQYCIFLPRTSEIYYNQLAELVSSFI